MYNDTVTLFNRYRANGTDTWYPTVLTNVDLNVDVSAIRKAYGADSKDRAKLHVFDINGTVGGKTYYLPKDWSGSGITFHDGELFDFFWAGTWTGRTERINGVDVLVWNVNDEDYTNGFYDYMRKTYDMVFAITSVARYSVIPHFEIMGA